MNNSKQYTAKVLLFGEHTILRGSRALAEPLPVYSCQWRQDIQQAKRAADLLPFGEYLQAELPDQFAFHRLQQDLKTGWYLDSTIPVGYGLGSSGSVCAAVFDRYATPLGQEQLVAEGAKDYLARMESYFHGASSGTDPLIIHLQETLELFPDGRFQPAQITALPDPWTLFLLDTKKSRKTATCVNYFIERFDTDMVFRQAVEATWIPQTNAAIDAYKRGDPLALQTAFRTISQFQFDHLPPMVIPPIRPAWEQGLQTEHYLLKICGSGGGGCCLGLTQDWTRTSELLSRWEIIPLEQSEK